MPSSINSMNRPVIIAHRGFHRDLPENTLEAFRAAIALGADGVEFDVHETADGWFVVHHDDEIANDPIGKMTLDEIQQYRLYGIYMIPTLQQAIEVLGKGLVLLVELKRVRSLDRFLAVLRPLVDPAWTFLVSFDEDLIKRLDVLAPEFTCIVIRMPGAGASVSGVQEGIDFLQVSCAAAGREQVEQAHARRRLVFAWDHGSGEDLKRALGHGIDVIMTDRPDVVMKMTGRSTA